LRLYEFLLRARKSCCLKKEFHDFTGKMRYSLFYRFRDTTFIVSLIQR
jgi:hypothetical protein